MIPIGTTKTIKKDGAKKKDGDGSHKKDGPSKKDGDDAKEDTIAKKYPDVPVELLPTVEELHSLNEVITAKINGLSGITSVRGLAEKERLQEERKATKDKIAACRAPKQQLQSILDQEN